MKRGQMPWHSTQSLARQTVRRWPEQTKQQQWIAPGQTQWRTADAFVDTGAERWRVVQKEPQK